MLHLFSTAPRWSYRPAQLLVGAILALSAGIASANEGAPQPPPSEEAAANTIVPTLGLKVPDKGGLTVTVQSHVLRTTSPPEANDDGRQLPQVDLQFPQEYGLASWYGTKQHQKRTASGELFDMHDFTAAHPTLPFGSRVCVRSALTGREVVVRINDRGPHGGKRVIDISRAAAEALGIVQLGTKPVTLQPLPDEDSTCPPA